MLRRRLRHVINQGAVLGMFFMIPLIFGGCASVLQGQSSSDAPVSTAPSSVGANPEFKDILVPNELNWDREDSMLIKTASFEGGVLSYNGRVDVQSLADFFVNNMQKNGWTLMGTVKYKNVLLSFTKPNKTCLISIFEPTLSINAKVIIHVTNDLGSGGYIREESLR